MFDLLGKDNNDIIAPWLDRRISFITVSSAGAVQCRSSIRPHPLATMSTIICDTWKRTEN